MTATHLIDLTPESLPRHTHLCARNPDSPGFRSKHQWFNERYNEGLKTKLLVDAGNKPIGFIEYLPADLAWRPVFAPGFMFIHCMYVYPNKHKNKGYGSMLVNACEEDARARNMAGICVMTSSGSWIAGKDLFKKNGFNETDTRGRFELLSKKWDKEAANPCLMDWTLKQKDYKGWHLLHADQCPWHEKAVQVLQKTANEYGVALTVTKIKSSEEAKNGPSGFGVFGLLRDGRLLEDHYISETRFRNILKKEKMVPTR